MLIFHNGLIIFFLYIYIYKYSVKTIIDQKLQNYSHWLDSKFRQMNKIKHNTTN
jgi:hypothetical protein